MVKLNAFTPLGVFPLEVCGNVQKYQTLFNFDPPVNAEEVRAASLQFVRKITVLTNRRRPTKFRSWPPSMK